MLWAGQGVASLTGAGSSVGARGGVGVDGVGVHRGRVVAIAYTICKPSSKL